MIKSHFHVQSGTIWAVQNMSCAKYELFKKNKFGFFMLFHPHIGPSSLFSPVKKSILWYLVLIRPFPCHVMSLFHLGNKTSPLAENTFTTKLSHLCMTLKPNGGMGRLQVTSLLCVFLSPPVQSGHWGQFKGTKNCHWFFLICNIFCQHYDALIWHYLLIKQLRL